MKLVVINGPRGMGNPLEIQPDRRFDTLIMSTYSNTKNVRGVTIERTYLVGITEEGLKEVNPELHAAIRNRMVTTEGKFVE